MNVHEAALFGVRIFAADLKSAVEFVVDRARARTSGIVCVANADMVTRAKRDSKLRAVMTRAALVVSDGMPLVWMLRALGFPTAERVYGPDLMWNVCSACAEADLPIFLYGGSADELEKLQTALKKGLPRLQVAGAISPPLLPADPPANPKDCAIITSSGAAVVFVGLGCPKQEYWMLNNESRVPAVVIGVGYAFAQIAGTKARAPVWMARRGLEWAYRLWQEPRRLWLRYVVGNSLFLLYSAQALVARRTSRFWQRR